MGYPFDPAEEEAEQKRLNLYRKSLDAELNGKPLRIGGRQPGVTYNGTRDGFKEDLGAALAKVRRQGKKPSLRSIATAIGWDRRTLKDLLDHFDLRLPPKLTSFMYQNVPIYAVSSLQKEVTGCELRSTSTYHRQQSMRSEI